MQFSNISPDGQAVGYQAAPAPQPAPRSGQTTDPNRKMQETQDQVNEVVVIMRDNMERVLQRDEKLSELDSRADALQDVSQQFSTTTTRLKRKYWWKNLKMWLILGGITIVIIIIIIVAIVTSVQK